MKAEDFFEKSNYSQQIKDKLDKGINRFSYYDMVDFAEGYHEAKKEQFKLEVESAIKAHKSFIIPKGKGYLVETKKGLKGRTFHSQSLHEGKVKVYLLDENFGFKKGNNGQALKMLCEPSSLKRIGFID